MTIIFQLLFSILLVVDVTVVNDMVTQRSGDVRMALLGMVVSGLAGFWLPQLFSHAFSGGPANNWIAIPTIILAAVGYGLTYLLNGFIKAAANA